MRPKSNTAKSRERICHIRENFGTYTLLEWAKIMGITISAASHFFTRHELHRFCKEGDRGAKKLTARINLFVKHSGERTFQEWSVILKLDETSVRSWANKNRLTHLVKKPHKYYPRINWERLEDFRLIEVLEKRGYTVQILNKPAEAV